MRTSTVVKVGDELMTDYSQQCTLMVATFPLVHSKKGWPGRPRLPDCELVQSARYFAVHTFQTPVWQRKQELWSRRC